MNIIMKYIFSKKLLIIAYQEQAYTYRYNDEQYIMLQKININTQTPFIVTNNFIISTQKIQRPLKF